MGGACACLEAVHSTWTGYRANLAQNTADNASAGQVAIGPRLPVTDLMALDIVAVRLHDGSRTLGQGMGTDGHPLDAVARLARELAATNSAPASRYRCASAGSVARMPAARTVAMPSRITF